MSWKEDNQPISESHRTLYRLWKLKMTEVFFFFLMGSLGAFMIIENVKDYFYTKEDRYSLQRIREYKQQADMMYSQGRLDNTTYTQYIDMLRKSEEKILSQYSSPYFTIGIFTTKSKLNFAFIYGILFFAIAGGFYFLNRETKKHANFFYQSPQQEDPLGLSGEIKIRFFVSRKMYKDVINEVFNNIDDFMRVLQYASKGLDEKKAKEVVNRQMNNISSFIKKFYPNLDKAVNYLRIEVILWHYVASLYGNAPTGLIGKHIKDYTLRKMLTLYYRKHLPVMFDVVNGNFMERDYDAYILLSVLYHADEKFKIFDELKKNLDPLPF